MKITTHSGNWEEIEIDALAIPLEAEEALDSELNVRLDGLLGELVESGEWSGKRGACTLIHRVPESSIKRLFLLGLGETPMPRHWFTAAGQAVRQAAKAQCRTVAILLPADADARLIAEGALYGFHRTSGYKEAKPWSVEEVILLSPTDVAEADRGKVTAEGVNLARELVEIPANDLGPEEFAMRAAQEGAAAGLEVEVLDEQALAQMGAGALLLWVRVRSAPPVWFV